MDSFFSSPDLFHDTAQKKISCCGTVRLHRKGMPKDLKPKTPRVKCGDIRVRTRGDLMAVVWKDKRDVCLLTNIHNPPREGNYRKEHQNAIKPAIVAIITVTWGMLIMQIGWPIATQPAVEHGSGHKSSFSTCWTWPLSTVTSFYLHVVGKKSHTEIFNSPLSEIRWHKLGMNHDHPCL